MESFHVRIQSIEKRRNAQGKVISYKVIWYVAGRKKTKTFPKSGQAEAFKSRLNVAQKAGEPFGVESREPVSWAREQEREREAAERREKGRTTWYTAVRSYVDEKWEESSGNHRAGLAYAFSLATIGMLPPPDKRPYSDQEIRIALRRWGFNKAHRAEAHGKNAEILEWVAATCRPMRDLERQAVTRALLKAATTKADGKDAALSTKRRHQVMIAAALKHGLAEGLLEAHPFTVHGIATPSRRAAIAKVDRRCVVNPRQAARLIEAVGEIPRSGPRLKAFFGSLYYSALRPEELVPARWKEELVLPATDSEWAEWTLSKAAPEVGKDWTDSGESRDSGPLKHREQGEHRYPPIPPEGVELLRQHREEFGEGPGGLIFFGEQGRPLSVSTIMKVWGQARKKALTEEEQASPLARRPYDLRHAGISLWLQSGVADTQASEWAGNSPEVLRQAYAWCLSGQQNRDKESISRVLRSW